MIKTLLLAILVVVSLPSVSAETDSTATAPKQTKGKQSPERAEMSRLIKESLGLAVKTISGNDGGIYPYGMTMDQSGKISLKGYSGKKAKAPPQDKWVKNLSHSLRQATSSNPDIVAASITRLRQVKNDQGEQVPGVWILADHRKNQPWVAFFPLVKNDSGKHEVGDPAYQATKQWLFSENSEESKSAASSEN